MNFISLLFIMPLILHVYLLLFINLQVFLK